MVRESRLHPDDLIAPLFVKEGADAPIPISSLPGQFQHTRDSLRQEVREIKDLGVPAVVLFGLPEHKDPEGSEAWNPDGIIQVAIQDLKDDHGDDLVVIADLCVDEYTSHGHCGVLDDHGQPDNDATLEVYAAAGSPNADSVSRSARRTAALSTAASPSTERTRASS